MSRRRTPRHRRAEPPRCSGIVNLYKPVWESSAQYVYKLRDILGEWKVGHAGTLDPFADGVLIACVGRGTKLVERLMRLPKVYQTRLRLGVTNETYDTERPFEPVPSACQPDERTVCSALARFHGEIEQAPPAFSAVKIGGVPSYRLARDGGTDDRPTKRVVIYDLTHVGYEWPLLTLRITCGRGTYIRALARDLGAQLACGACCEALRREAVGPFTIADSLRLDTATADECAAALIPPDEAVARIEGCEREYGIG